MDIVLQRHYGWMIYVQYNMPGIEKDEVMVCLAVTLINRAPQADGIKVCHPEQGGNQDKM